MMFDTDMAMMFDTDILSIPQLDILLKGINWNWNCMTKVYRWYISMYYVWWWLWKHYDDDYENIMMIKSIQWEEM
jgi:hypothetical protein